MSFALAARIVSVVCTVLFVILCFFPASYAPTYGVAAHEAAQFTTRRAAPMFIGVAVVLWAAASAPRSPLRDAIAGGVAVMWLAIAATGVVAWGQGVATPAILVAAVLESTLAAALWFTRKN